MPSPGRITALRVPDGPGIRDDSGTEAGGEVTIFYDPLISKLVAWGTDRTQAIARMQRALREYEVRGIRTSVEFFRWMLRQPAFVEADFHTEMLDELLQQRRGTPFAERDPSLEEVALVTAAIFAVSGRCDPPGRHAGPVVTASAQDFGGSDRPGSRRRGWKTQARLDGLRG